MFFLLQLRRDISVGLDIPGHMEVPKDGHLISLKPHDQNVVVRPHLDAIRGRADGPGVISGIIRIRSESSSS